MLAFLDLLLRRAALVLEDDHPRGLQTITNSAALSWRQTRAPKYARDPIKATPNVTTRPEAAPLRSVIVFLLNKRESWMWRSEPKFCSAINAAQRCVLLMVKRVRNECFLGVTFKKGSSLGRWDTCYMQAFVSGRRSIEGPDSLW